MTQDQIIVDGVEFSIGDELIYDGEVRSEIVDFEVMEAEKGEEYWLIVRRVETNRRARYLAGSIAVSVQSERGYEISD